MLGRLAPLALLLAVAACKKGPETSVSLAQENFKKTLELRNATLYPTDVTELADGSLFVLGGATPAGQPEATQKIVGLKLTAAGDTVWSRRYTYGPADEYVGYGFSFTCLPTADGNVVFSGYTVYPAQSNYRHYQSVVTKVNGATGAILWTVTTPADIIYGVSKIVSTSDGGFLLLNKVTEDLDQTFNLHKISAAGALVSSTTHVGDLASDISPTADGNYIVVGINNSYSENQIFLTKITPQGSELWRHTPGATHFGLVNNVVQTTDGGYAVVNGLSVALSDSVRLLKTAADGQQQSVRVIGHPTQGRINQLDRGPGSSLLMAGFLGNGNGAGNAVFLHTSATGVEQLRKVNVASRGTRASLCNTRSGTVVLCSVVAGGKLEIQRLNADLTE